MVYGKGWVNLDPVLLHSKHMGWVNPDPALLHSKCMGWVHPDPVLWVNPDPVLLQSKCMGVGQTQTQSYCTQNAWGGSTRTQSYCIQNAWGRVNPDPVLLHSKCMESGQPRPSLTALKVQALSAQVLVSTCKHFFHDFHTIQQSQKTN